MHAFVHDQPYSGVSNAFDSPFLEITSEELASIRERFYTGRATGSDRDYRYPRRSVASGRSGRSRGGAKGNVFQQSETNRSGATQLPWELPTVSSVSDSTPLARAQPVTNRHMPLSHLAVITPAA